MSNQPPAWWDWPWLPKPPREFPQFCFIPGVPEVDVGPPATLQPCGAGVGTGSCWACAATAAAASSVMVTLADFRMLLNVYHLSGAGAGENPVSGLYEPVGGAISGVSGRVLTGVIS